MAEKCKTNNNIDLTAFDRFCFSRHISPVLWCHFLWNYASKCKQFKVKHEPPHDKTNKMACASSKDSDQPGHPPSLIKVFTVRMKTALVLSYLLSAQWGLWSDWVDAQADLSLGWAHMPFCWFCHEAAQHDYHKNYHKYLDRLFKFLGPGQTVPTRSRSKQGLHTLFAILPAHSGLILR